MSEKQEIIQREVGFQWRISIKKTTRKPKEGSKYDDVTEAEATLSGNEETYEIAAAGLNAGRSTILEILRKTD